MRCSLRVGIAVVALGTAIGGTLGGCYSLRGSAGGGQAPADRPRRIEAADVAVPVGYRVEVVATGLTFPTGVAFDGDGRPHVVEAGYSYGEVWTTPRLLRVEPDGRLTTIVEGARNGPWTGVDYADGAFFVAEGGQLEGGRILRIGRDRHMTRLVEDLPSKGDHHTNGPAVGPDGWIYFGQGTATNSGVVGPDNARFGWLARNPDVHDVPCADIRLTGRNFRSTDVRDSTGEAITGGFVPYGSETHAGQVVRGDVRCSGAILRVRATGGEPEVVAWGFRNPFALAFDSRGALWVVSNGYDSRGSRPVFGGADHLWRVEKGTWYGWPDYHGTERLADGEYRAGDEALDPLIADPPNVPPRPAAAFPSHSSADGIDFSTSDDFGFVGEAFVAQFGDEAPTTGKVLAPVGFKVVRVDVATGVQTDFAVNRGETNGPASKIGGGGLERPVSLRFTPDGRELYVIDFGIMRQDERGAHPQPGTGVLWRIVRATGRSPAGGGR